MKSLDFENVSPQALRQYQKDHGEREYLLVDVRQPEEYTQGHIPGSKLMPLDELESNLGDLPVEKDIFFYCRSGARSQAAAIISLDSGHPLQKVYNLIGGMLAWDGRSLSEFPRMNVFKKDASLADLMMTAMDLEKAALRFYESVFDTYAQAPYAPVLETLSKAEEAHARTIYRYWQKAQNNPLPFSELFSSLQGEVLEGGETLMNAIQRLASLGDTGCGALMEFALNVEVQAYDLYRNMANTLADTDAQDAFLSISQMEKKHMGLVARVFKQCAK